jgi:diaminohydroxyphosphoribosylaminopyrimidine deaminase / 5-amino-6-(5-phosphoribosylamino)uracil reductase
MAATRSRTSVTPVHVSAEDRAFVDRAVELGRQGWGCVQPNPMVGCVLVKEGAVIAEGWHHEYGGPHAEVDALAKAGAAAKGATAYVSLEPCKHEGKTPPCTGALLDAGIARVVFGGADPGIDSGGGGDTLRQAGVEVVGPVLTQREAIRENPAFFHNARTGSVFVALKLAMSLDARIAARVGERTEITGPEAHRWVHGLRAGHDAVMVGAGTAQVDDPRLTVREAVAARRQPARLVVDSNATLSADSRLFRDIETAPLIVFVREEAPRASVARLEAAGAQVHRVPAASGGVDLGAVLRTSWKIGLRSILTEGGGTLASSFLQESLIQRLYLLFAPRTFGSGGVPAFADLPDSAWSRWAPAGPSQPLGDDALIVYDRLPFGVS